MAMFRCGKLKVMSQTEPNVNGIFNLWVQAKIFSKCQPHGSMANWIQFCTEFTFVSNPKDNYSHDHWPLDQSCLGKKNEWSVSIMYMNHDCWLAFLAHDYQQMEVANTTPTRLTKEIHAQFRPLQPTTTWPHPVGDHQPVREVVSYHKLFTAGWFDVREKHCSRLKIYDRLQASEQARHLVVWHFNSSLCIEQII